jgi:hypothetical protein
MVTPMKSAKATSGSTPSKLPAEPRPPSESHARLTIPRWRAAGEVERSRWARCEDSTLPPAPAEADRDPLPEQREEPSTGVVHKLDDVTSQRDSGVMERPTARRESSPLRPPRRGIRRGAGGTGDWRCLEWGQGPGERRSKRNPKVTIVQLSSSGDLIRQNGPDTWLPEAGDFVHRMAHLVAHGLGFERCRSVCLRSDRAVLTVTEAAGTKVVAVSGPAGSMSNVLRRAGLR